MVSSSRAVRPRGQLRRGLAASLLIHLNLIGPLIIATFIFAAREEAAKPDEVDVAFEDVRPDELPTDLPQLDESPQPEAETPAKEKPKKEIAKKDPLKKELTKKPPEKVAELKPVPPEPEVVTPPLPPMPQPPPPPPPQEKRHEKMVELDNDKDVPPPEDAKYLAQKNNRAEIETRATDTNLEREQKGEEASRTDKASPKEQPDPGDEKTKIAELDEQKSLAGRQAPDVVPRQNPQAPTTENQSAPPERPTLALRDRPSAQHEVTPETADPSLPHDPTGLLPRPSLRKMRDGEAARPGAEQRPVKLAITGKDYEYIFGADAKAERELAQKQRSTREGRHSQRLARVRASLENFIPEVKPGNQTALNTRADPFAQFIARMHRNIHKLWGFGALEDWDELPASSPFNDESLLTKLEIVLNADGTVNKVTVVRPSRVVAFDVAAIDAVFSAGPYPEPPRAIRSGNGKIYVHWTFHRDARQCATDGVSPFILDNAPSGGDSDGAGTAASGAPASGGAATASAGAAMGALPPAAQRLTPAGGAPAGGAPSALEPPRRLERHPEHDHNGAGHIAHATAPSAGESSGEAPSTAGARSLDAAAANLVRDWFAAFSRGDVSSMTARATFPFRASTISVGNRQELGRMLTSLLAESSSRAVRAVSVETGAGLRRRFGKLPPGLDDGSAPLFGVGELDRDELIMVLANTGQGWKVAGLVRR